MPNHTGNLLCSVIAFVSSKLARRTGFAVLLNFSRPEPAVKPRKVIRSSKFHRESPVSQRDANSDSRAWSLHCSRPAFVWRSAQWVTQDSVHRNWPRPVPSYLTFTDRAVPDVRCFCLWGKCKQSTLTWPNYDILTHLTNSTGGGDLFDTLTVVQLVKKLLLFIYDSRRLITATRSLKRCLPCYAWDTKVRTPTNHQQLMIIITRGLIITN